MMSLRLTKLVAKFIYLSVPFWMVSSYANGSEDIRFQDDLIEFNSIIQQRRDDTTSLQFPSNILQIIHSRPLFLETRRPSEQGPALEISRLIVNGHATTVELIGTIYSQTEQTAGFTLGGEDIVWLQRNQYLGDWRIDEITPSQVRLINMDKSHLISLRESTGN